MNCMAGVGKSGTVATNSKPTSARSTVIDGFFRPAMLFRMSLVAGVCALWPYVAQKLPSLSNRPEYTLTFQQIQIRPVPNRPIPMNLVEQVRELTHSANELSILDQKLTFEIADRFSQHPWVLKVVRVKKSFPAAIIVELQYRQPVAMVQIPGGRVPIDIHGVVLPSADFSPGDANQFPLIMNAVSQPKIRPGTAWNDPGIIAAARLANSLKDKWQTLKLEGIWIPRIGDSITTANDVPLELVGRGGSRIVWGRAPGNDHPGELEPTQKIRRLEKYLVDFGDYGQPNGPYVIDIHHWQETTRHPLVTDPVPAKPARSQKDEARHQNFESKKKTRI